MPSKDLHFKKILKDFKVKVDFEIRKQFDIIVNENKDENPLVAESLEYSKHLILSGGKRLRGALLYYGYLGAGGKDKKSVLKAAAAAEIGHLFVLMHDDIVDHGTLRHNVETLNKKYADPKYSKANPIHFGNSMALIIGDMIYAIMNKIILEAKFDQKSLLSGLLQLHKVSITTAIGQIQDISIGNKAIVSSKEVLAMYKNKTAKYTFEGPLRIGMILAGCTDKKTLTEVSDYAIPIGISFQIQDDILGIFGNEEQLGKSIVSDIEEGKNTLLFVKALELSSSEQKKMLRAIFGKKNLSQKEILSFRKILVETGALEYAKKISRDHLNKGKEKINASSLSKQTKKMLTELIQYLEKREL